MDHRRRISRRMLAMATPVRRTPLLSLDGFDSSAIEEAKKIIQGTSAWFSFDAEGHLIDRQPLDNPSQAKLSSEQKEVIRLTAHHADEWAPQNIEETVKRGLTHEELMKRAEATLRPQSDWDTQKCAMAEAVVALAVNHQNAKVFPESTIRLTAFSKHDDSMTPRENLGGFSSHDLCMIVHDLGGLEKLDEADKEKIEEILTSEEHSRCQWLQDNLQRYAALMRGEILPDKGGHDEEDGDDWVGKIHSSPKLLLRQCADDARSIQRRAQLIGRPDHWQRLANEFPDAVRFIGTLPQHEFLLSYGGARGAVEDPVAFVQSGWMKTVGRAELQVDPSLLASLQAELRGRTVERS